MKLREFLLDELTRHEKPLTDAQKDTKFRKDQREGKEKLKDKADKYKDQKKERMKRKREQNEDITLQIEDYLVSENQDMEVSGVYGRNFDKELNDAGIHFQYSGRRYTIYDVDNKIQDKVVDIIKDLADTSRDVDRDEVIIRLRGRTFRLDDFK